MASNTLLDDVATPVQSAAVSHETVTAVLPDTPLKAQLMPLIQPHSRPCLSGMLLVPVGSVKHAGAFSHLSCCVVFVAFANTGAGGAGGMYTGIGAVTSATGGGDGNGDATGDVTFDPLSAAAGELLPLVIGTVSFVAVGGPVVDVALRPVALPAGAGDCRTVVSAPAVKFTPLAFPA